jgi:hypothetical protein
MIIRAAKQALGRSFPSKSPEPMMGFEGRNIIRSDLKASAV